MNLNDKINRDFKKFLNEGNQQPSVYSYLQSLEETINSFAPKSLADQRRKEIAKSNVGHIRRHLRRTDEEINIMKEEMRIIKEGSTEKK